MELKNKVRPEPPKPPEMRLSCSSCGYTAPESIFKKNHKRCYPGLVVCGVLITFAIVVLGSAICIMLKGQGVI